MISAQQIGKNIYNKAVSHLGEKEIPAGSNNGPQVNRYLAFCGLDPGNPWCACFASFVTYYTLLQMGLSSLPCLKTASSHEAVNWGMEHKTIQTRDSCVTGDWLIERGGNGDPADDGFSYHHTVILDYVDANGTCFWVGGNTSNSVAAGTCNIDDCCILRPYVVF